MANDKFSRGNYNYLKIFYIKFKLLIILQGKIEVIDK